MPRNRMVNRREISVRRVVSKMRLLPRRDDGQSLVETVFTLPAFLLVMITILYFGTVLFNYISLSQATSVALRQLVISRGQTTDPCATVVAAVTNSTAAMNDAKIVYNLTLNGTTYTGTSCTSAAANMVNGAQVQVKLTYAGITTITTLEQDRVE